MHSPSLSRTFGAIIAVSVALLVAPSPASAENDPYGVFVNDRTGQRWVTMSPSEYLASPITLDMQARMEALSQGDFKAGAASAFEETPDPKWDVFQIGDVTRFRSVTSKRTSIRYVTDDRVCTRKVSKASNDTLKADRTARWNCTPPDSSTPGGREFVKAFLPLSVVSPAKDGELRVLMKEGLSMPAPGAANASLTVIIKQIGVLRSVGLAGGPSEVFAFTTTATNMETEAEAFDGYSWLLSDFVLSTTLLPRLPRIP